MKKTLFALTALSVVGAANAASTTLTLYGVIDTGIEYVNRVAASPTTPNVGGSRLGMLGVGGLSASRWGLRGTEDLGGGNQALFVLEDGFVPSTGAILPGALFTRMALVGLKSDLGQVTVGRQTTSLLDGMVNFAPLRFAVTYEPGTWWLGVNYRESNMVKYTGQFGPLQAVAHYSFGTGVPVLSTGNLLANGGAGETPGASRDNTAFGGSLMYLNSTFGIGIGYDQWNPAVVTGQTGKVRKVSVGANYGTGPYKLYAGYRWNEANFSNGNTLIRDNYWWLGGTYQLTPALGLSLAYYYADVKSAAATATAPSTNPPNMQQYTLQADYSLSKRTDLYVTVGYAHNGSLVFDSAVTGFTVNDPTMTGQKNMVGVVTGIRHIF